MEADVTSVALIGVLAVLAIVVVHRLAPRVGVATPLLLVVLGVAVSFIPAIPAITVEPELVLAGVLPPLLYATAVSLPAMDFRRDFLSIGALSVALVVLGALALGAVLSTVVPGMPLSVGIALGAILSPTDAVATTIVRRLGVSPRLVTVLEGESLLNDATALVLLRSAVAATAMSVPAWQIGGRFVWSVVGAVAIGTSAGWGGLWVRRWLANPVLSTAVSFVVPFLAYLPTEALGASGLVGVAAAGLVTGHGKADFLSPQDRRAEASNWRTVAFLLEGGVFLLMGLELFGLVDEVVDEHESLWLAVGLAALAVAVVLVVRSAFIAGLLVVVHRQVARGRALRDALRQTGSVSSARTAAGPGVGSTATAPDLRRLPEPVAWRVRRRFGRMAGAAGIAGATGIAGAAASDVRPPLERSGRLHRRLSRHSTDIDYFTAEPLGPREGVLLVWAGMRGVVTLAAAQSLPAGLPKRPLLVLVAFLVAAGSLLVQGGTLPALARALGLTGDSRSDSDRLALRRTLDAAALAALDDPALHRPDGGTYDSDLVARARRDVDRMRASRARDASTSADRFAQYRELRLAAIAAQRRALARARSGGAFSSRTLQYALGLLDSEQIELQARRGPVTFEDEGDEDS